MKIWRWLSRCKNALRKFLHSSNAYIILFFPLYRTICHIYRYSDKYIFLVCLSSWIFQYSVFFLESQSSCIPFSHPAAKAFEVVCPLVNKSAFPFTFSAWLTMTLISPPVRLSRGSHLNTCVGRDAHPISTFIGLAINYLLSRQVQRILSLLLFVFCFSR